MGRPTKLTPTLIDVLVEVISAGNTNRTASGVVGIHPRTLRRWYAEGEKEHYSRQEGGKRDPKKDRVVELYTAVNRARADAVISMVEIVTEAAKRGTWQAAAWWLERNNPAEYGRTSRESAINAGDGGALFEALSGALHAYGNSNADPLPVRWVD